MSATKMPPPAAVARDAHWSHKMAKLRQYKPLEQAVRLSVDPSVAHGLELAQRAADEGAESGYDESSEQHAARLERLKADLEAAQDAVAEATVEILLRGLPRDVYEQLLADHPPTDEQKGRDEVYNVEAFAPALVAACHVELNEAGDEVRGMSASEAAELFGILNQGDASALFSVAQLVCTAPRVGLGKG